MTTWIIPEGITEITQGFVRANIPPGITDILIPNNVQSIGIGALKDCTGLEAIVIPESVQSIGDGAFNYCTRLESIVISEGVKSIGNGTFARCVSLKSIVIPHGIQSIGWGAFRGCESLESIVIPESVQSIGPDAFMNCRSLNLIVLPDALVKKRLEYGITDYRVVLSCSDRALWKTRNGLENKSYSDQAMLFLYQLQNVESFNPPWNEVLMQYPEISAADIIKFSGDKQNCKPPWARANYQGIRNSKVSLEDTSIQYYQGKQVLKNFNNLGHVIFPYLSVGDAEAFTCISKEKNILIPPISSQRLFSEANEIYTDPSVREAKFQDLKVLSFTACAVLAMGVGIAYMQRHDGVNNLGFGL